MATRLYRVQSGQSLSSIARDELREPERWSEIAYINEISAPYTVYPGQMIMLPVDTQPLQVVIRAPGGSPKPGAAATDASAIRFTPAMLAVALVVAVALLMQGDFK